MADPTVSDVPLLLVDGHNLLFRAAFSTPAEIRAGDAGRQDITTQFMFPALLRKGILTELGTWPEVLVVFDGEHGARARQEADGGYKANRPDPGQGPGRNPLAALPEIKAMLDRFGIVWIEVEDAEADDVIATLVAACPHRNILINSTDQDFYQLLTDPAPGRGYVHVMNTAARPGARMIGPAQVLERFGVTPAQFTSLRALAGDASDNIAGVKGVGAKSAAALLAGGLLLAGLPDSGRLEHGAKGAAITAAWPRVETWHAMICMRADVPLPSTPTGRATAPLPRPRDMIEAMGLWGEAGAVRPPKARRPVDALHPAH